MDQRSMAILNHLIKADSYKSVQELARTFNVSRRTVYNDIDKINDWLQENGLLEIKQVRSEGLYIENDTKKEILKKQVIFGRAYYEFSPIERRAWIYIHIIGRGDPCYLENIRDLFEVSRNTVLEDIKKLKEEIQQYGLIIQSERKKGYQIIGNENDIRRLIIYYLSHVVPKEGWYGFLSSLTINEAFPIEQDLKPYTIFDTHLLSDLREFLYEYEQQIKVEITDEVVNNLVVLFYFFIIRIRQGKLVEVDPVEKEVIETTEEYQGAKAITKHLSQKHSNLLPNEEICYFVKYLLSAKVNYNQSPQLESQEMRELLQVIEKMVADFQWYAAIEFEHAEHMIENLLLHLKPAFYRIKYGIRIENELRDTVKKNYPEVFHITKQVIHHFEDIVNQPIDDNEVAYITMHFGGWLRKEGVILEQTRKKLLIVCTNGLGTSRLLESQLEGLFSNIEISDVTSLREYERMVLNVDFIISTIPLTDRGVPVFVVNPVLSNEDKEQLFKKVNSLFVQSPKEQTYSVDTLVDMIKRHGSIDDEEALRLDLRMYLQAPLNVEGKVTKPTLEELLPDNRIILKKGLKSWQDAIKIAARPLLEQGYIEESYVEKMIHVITENGPYVVISDRFALPHASPDDGVNKTGMSLLHLVEPVNMLGKDVSVFVVLASRDNEQHLKALSQLTKLFTNTVDKQKIMNTTDKKEISQLIQTHSTD